MFRFEILCSFLVLILESVSGQGCSLKIRGNSPIIQRYFGTLNFFQKYPDLNKNYIHMNNDEIIDAFCEGSFDDFEIDVKKLTFKCTRGSLSILEPKDLDHVNANGYFGCSTVFFQLFESNETLSNCEDWMSYGIGQNTLSEIKFSSAGLCYDLKTLNIKYVKYLAYPKEVFYPKQHDFNELTIIQLDTEINNFEIIFGNSLMSPESFRELYRRKQEISFFLKNIEFDYTSLLQDSGANERYQDFAKMFNIVWWRELRERNWFYFQNEFDKQNKNVTYLIHTGVSGIVKLPSNKNLELSEGEKLVNAPEYIWMYLKSVTSNVDDEFVIVGHNTPFRKANDIENICDDICDEIVWLRNTVFKQLHLMPAYGLINCCHPEDVASKLENFPFDQDKLKRNINEVSTESNKIH